MNSRPSPAKTRPGPDTIRPAAAQWPFYVLGIAIAAVYANSLRGAFVFDDNGSILENPAIWNLTDLRTVLLGGEFTTVVGRPLLSLSLAVNWAISGPNPWSYHVFNVAVHMGCAVTLYALVRETLERLPEGNRVRDEARGIALATSVLWGVHPVTTLAVTYTVQRAEAMAAFFYLLGLLAVLRAGANPSAGVVLAAGGSAVLGALCKETIATLPILALAYDRTFLAASVREMLARRGRVHAALFACWPVLSVLILSNKGRGGTAGLGYGVSPVDYSLTQIWAVARYLQVAVWPVDVIFDHGAPLIVTWRALWPSVLVVGLVLGVTAVLLVRAPRLGFLGLWFFLILAPTSTVIPVITHTIAEHRMYLSLAAPLLALALALTLTVGELERRTGRQAVRFVGVGLVAAVAVGLAYHTLRNNAAFESPRTFWALTVDRNPVNLRALTALGVAQFDANDNAAARLAWTRGLELYRTGQVDPLLLHNRSHASLIYSNLAGMYNLEGNFDRALPLTDEALERQLGSASVYTNRAVTLRGLGRFDDALAAARTSLRYGANQPIALEVEIHALYALGRYDEALDAVDRYHATGAAPSEELLATLRALKQALDQRAVTGRESRPVSPSNP